MDDDKKGMSLSAFFAGNPNRLPVQYRRVPISIHEGYINYTWRSKISGKQALPFIKELRLKHDSENDVIDASSADFIAEVKETSDHILISAHIPGFSRDVRLFSDGTIICFDRCYHKKTSTQTVFSTNGDVEVLITGWNARDGYSGEYASRSLLPRGAESMHKQWLKLEVTTINLIEQLPKPLWC